MAALTITPEDVGIKGDRSKVRNVTMGEAFSPGQPVYLGGDTKYYLCDADNSEKVGFAGVTLTGGAADDHAVIIYSGPMDIGATLTLGEIYIIGATPGAIHPVGDAAAGWYPSVVGTSEDAGTLWVTSVVARSPRP